MINARLKLEDLLAKSKKHLQITLGEFQPTPYKKCRVSAI